MTKEYICKINNKHRSKAVSVYFLCYYDVSLQIKPTFKALSRINIIILSGEYRDDACNS